MFRFNQPIHHIHRRSLWQALGASAAMLLATSPSAAQPFTPTPPQYTALEAVLAGFDARVAAEVRDDGIGAITAGVVLGDGLIWKKSWGWSDVERREQATPEGVYRLGSVTKVFTAALLMRLVERRVIELDESVESYVPELVGLPRRPARGGPITFRQLASHSSGLALHPEVPDPARPVTDWEARLLEVLPKTPFVGAPGEQAEYSSVGYAILGLALQRAAGLDFMELLADEVTLPLGMTHTAYRISDEMREHLTGAYQNYSDGRMDPDAILRHQERINFAVGGNHLYSTVEDLGKLIAVLMADDGEHTAFLSPEGLREMRKVQAVRERQRRIGLQRGYGLALNVFEHESGAVFFLKDGYEAGYTAQIAFDPARKLGVVLLRNYNYGRTLLAPTSIQLLAELGQAIDHERSDPQKGFEALVHGSELRTDSPKGVFQFVS